MRGHPKVIIGHPYHLTSNINIKSKKRILINAKEGRNFGSQETYVLPIETVSSEGTTVRPSPLSSLLLLVKTPNKDSHSTPRRKLALGTLCRLWPVAPLAKTPLGLCSIFSSFTLRMHREIVTSKFFTKNLPILGKVPVGGVGGCRCAFAHTMRGL